MTDERKDDDLRQWCVVRVMEKLSFFDAETTVRSADMLYRYIAEGKLPEVVNEPLEVDEEKALMTPVSSFSTASFIDTGQG